MVLPVHCTTDQLDIDVREIGVVDIGIVVGIDIALTGKERDRRPSHELVQGVEACCVMMQWLESWKVMGGDSTGDLCSSEVDPFVQQGVRQEGNGLG